MEAVPGAGFVAGRRAGDAAALHADVALDRRRATWLEADRPALVLGSTQPDDRVDHPEAARRGVDVVRRRSGGGGVLLWPGEHLWLDVVVPRDDPLWDHDVGAAMWWLGDLWAEALSALGVTGAVHRGPLRRAPWSAEVCFAGLGAGEVHAAERKLVGISQRRTRQGARLQSMIHLRWRPEMHAALIAAPRPQPAELEPLVAVAGVPAPALRGAVESALASR